MSGRRRRGVTVAVKLQRPALSDRKMIAIIRDTCRSAAEGKISGPDALSWIAKIVGGRLVAGVAVTRRKGKN